MRFFWAPLLVISLISLADGVLRRRDRNAGVLLGVLLGWLVLQGFMLLVVNEGRYRKPAEGLIIAALLLPGARRQAEISGRSTGP